MAPRSHKSTATNKSNPSPQCCEDNNLFTENNTDAAIDRLADESEEDGGDVVFVGTIYRHSEPVFACSNAEAHPNGPHYTCKSCVSLANTYLGNTPNQLLDGGTPPMQGKRFFPLCFECAGVAKRSSTNEGCVCDYRDQDLCFRCKLELLERGAAKRDAEVKSRLGFVPAGTKKSDVLFVKPILKCMCGNENLYLQDGLQCTLCCVVCDGIVSMIGGEAWDPLAMDYKSFPEIQLLS